jgi:hypothetical protein
LDPESKPKCKKKKKGVAVIYRQVQKSKSLIPRTGAKMNKKLFFKKNPTNSKMEARERKQKACLLK